MGVRWRIVCIRVCLHMGEYMHVRTHRHTCTRICFFPSPTLSHTWCGRQLRSVFRPSPKSSKALAFRKRPAPPELKMCCCCVGVVGRGGDV